MSEGALRSTVSFTIADLEAMPDDGCRYELIGGAIVMTPAPGIDHQRVSRRLQRILEDANPGVEVFDAPIDLDLPGGQRVQPDLVAVEPGRTGKRLTLPVLLLVEILSEGSRTHDTVTKRAAYAEAGIGAYWIVDPQQPGILCLRLEEGAYVAYAEGPAVETAWPLSATVDVAALCRV